MATKVWLQEVGGKFRDQPYLPPESLKLNPDNPREDTAERRAWIRTIADSIKRDGYDVDQPIVFRRAGKDFIVEDGNCRLEAVLLAKSEGAAIEFVPCLQEPDGTTEEQRLARRITRNSKLPHTANDFASVIMRFRSWGWEDDRIAEQLQRSRTWLANVMMLADAPEPIREMVKEKAVSATEAVRVIREQGDAATETLQKAVEGAKAVGRTRVTRKAVETIQATPQARDTVVRAPVLHPAQEAIIRFLNVWDSAEKQSEVEDAVKTLREVV